MNLTDRTHTYYARLQQVILRTLRFLWKQTSRLSFGSKGEERIGHVYVINLDRQPGRWRNMLRELHHIRDDAGTSLVELTTRVSAVDGRFSERTEDTIDVVSMYTLGEQLFVDPRSVLPLKLDLDERIEMSRPEVAVAMSHIDVWRKIMNGPHEYALILEDDVRFKGNFARTLDKVWAHFTQLRKESPFFDVLYLSFKEVDYGAEKVLLTEHVSRVYRGLWYMSGYVLSKQGAKQLLDRLPVRGPVDLWINHKFSELDVYCASESLIEQRIDESSQNCYSILPILSKIGVLNSEGPGHFHRQPLPRPLFAVGPPSSGLSSLAIALSMLGYRCCSDIDSLPSALEEILLKATTLSKSTLPLFDAYVNVGSLDSYLDHLAEQYPYSVLIDTSPKPNSALERSQTWQDRYLWLPNNKSNKWKLLSEFLHIVPPACPYPEIDELGQRRLILQEQREFKTTGVWLEHDNSPWVANVHGPMEGVPSRCQSAASCISVFPGDASSEGTLSFSGHMWTKRSDTFQGNLALFDPSNVTINTDHGVTLTVRKDDMGVREYSAGALTSSSKYLFGSFSARLKPPKVSGLVTGVFLHRDSPRQEIDIEFLGNAPDKILVNVFYNPGGEGDRFDYGYRGTPCLIDLGFDYSKEFHEYSIEWSRDQIRWLVDGRVIHVRVNWAPTPIPHLPMRFHVNLWPTLSQELAGNVAKSCFPANLHLHNVSLPGVKTP